MFITRNANGIINGIHAGRTIGAIALTVVLLIVAFGSWFITPPGYVTILTRAGAITDTVYEEGLHLKLPVIDTPFTVNVQSVTWNHNKLDAGTSDLQRLTASVATNTTVDKVFAKEVFRNFRDADTLAKSVLGPAVEESLKAITSKYRSEQILAQRQRINEEFVATLRARVKPFHLIVNQVSITNLSFSEAFMTSIESKVTAEQNALRAVHDLTRIKTEAEQRIAEAKGQAEAIRVQAEAITKNGGAEYIQLQWIAKWKGDVPSTQLGAGSAIPLISIGK